VAALVVLGLVWTVDLRGAIGFSSVAVLVYYLLANLSAGRLGKARGGPPRWLTGAGALGCVLLAATLPLVSVLAGGGVLAAGVLARAVVDHRNRRPPEPSAPAASGGAGRGGDPGREVA
jgi:APA family basic amino acid/polyamine antiporter